MYVRHNCVRNAFAQLALDAGLNVQLEVVAPDNGLRPADVLVTGLEFAPCALDVAVVHELQPSLSFATMTTETAKQGEELRKLSSFGHLHRQSLWAFIPVVVNTSGRWGPRARGFMQSLIRHRALVLASPPAVEVDKCWSAANYALAAAVARQLERAFPRTVIPCPEESVGSPFPGTETGEDVDMLPRSRDAEDPDP